jgi:tetratricopeptide (TPR) repeat protein
VNIGSVYDSQGKYAEAMLQYQQALKIYDREFEVNHINSAGTLVNIGHVYSSQGKYAEAIMQSELALKIYDRQFGVNLINSA